MQVESDTRVLVTGATRGIGRALVGALAERRCTVGLLARSAAELEQVAVELQAAGAKAIALPADVGEREQVESAVSRFIDEAGAIDVLVINAGVAWYGPVREMPVEEAERMTRVNWLGTIYTVKAALPQMLDRAEGNITIVSSAAGHRSFPWGAVYGATKFAQRGFAEALRHELSGTGVKLTAVYPGLVDSHLHDDNRDHGRMPDWHRATTALSPQVVAATILSAIDQDEASVFVPSITRLLGIVHGISPKLADRLLRARLGAGAAPWRG